MHVVRLLARASRREPHQGHRFQAGGIRHRWEAGYADTMRALEQQPWIGEWGLLDAVILHEPMPHAELAVEQPSLEEVGTPQKHAAE